MSETLPPVTPDLKPLLALLGTREAVLALVEAKAGRIIYVPHKGEASELAAILGPAAFGRLVARYGGDRLQVPLGRAWRIQIRHARGMSHPDIAAELGMTWNGVWRSLKTAGLTSTVADDPTKPQQLDLFDSPLRQQG